MNKELKQQKEFEKNWKPDMNREEMEIIKQNNMKPKGVAQ